MKHAASSGQSGLCALVLLAVLLPLAIAQAAVRSDWVLLPFNLAKWKATNGLYYDKRFYGDDSDRFMFDDLPAADFSHGGVCFIGSSTLRYTVCRYELPPDLRPLIQNCAVSASNYSQQRQLLQFLLDHRGMRHSGRGRSLVLIQLYFFNATHYNAFRNEIWHDRWIRDGLYTFDNNGALQDLPLNPLQRGARLAQLRDDKFWAWANRAVRGRMNDVRPVLSLTREQIYSNTMEALNPDWSAGMDLELQQLAGTLDDLDAAGVKVVPLFFPIPTWFDGFAPNTKYRTGVDAVLRNRGLTPLDLSRALPDSDFADSVHLTYTGVHKIRPILIDVAEKFITEQGLSSKR